MSHSLENLSGAVEQEQVPQGELSVEGVKMDCASLISKVKEHYKKEVDKSPEREGTRQLLEVHNDIVLDYAVDISNMLGLDDREKAIAMLATILHDSAKLDGENPLNTLINHHTMGAEIATELAQGFVGESVNGYEVTADMVPEIAFAVRRHQNHPFLIKTFNKGERFEEPQTKADITVYLADMMANIGFKNIAFRFVNDKFVLEDLYKSREKMDDHLNQALDNVFTGDLGVENLINSVFKDEEGNELENLKDTLPVQEYMKKMIESAKKIYDRLKDELPKLESEIALKNPRSGGEIYESGIWNYYAELQGKTGKGAGQKLLVEKINELIVKIGNDLGIDEKTVNSFKM